MRSSARFARCSGRQLRIDLRIGHERPARRTSASTCSGDNARVIEAGDADRAGEHLVAASRLVPATEDHHRLARVEYVIGPFEE